MRRILMLLIVFAVAATFLAPSTVWADEIEDDVEELFDRVDALELKGAKNKISFFGDFRVRYDFQNRHIPAYNQVVGMQVDGTGTPTGMPLFIPVGEQDLKNSEAWSARLRLKMDAKVGKEIHFTGRLNMNRSYGGSAVPIFDGYPNTVLSAFNSTATPTDNLLRVERAAMTWSPEWTPLFLTVGRQAATGGPPRELRENAVRQGTPGALMIDAEIDGLMLGLRGADVGMPDGALIRFCYGTGFESGFGAGGNATGTYVEVGGMFGPDLQNASFATQFVPVGDLKDSKVMGGCAETPLPFVPGTTLLSAGYMRMIDMTDIPYGETRGFPNPFNTDPQVVTATANLGDMDLFGLCFQHEIEVNGYDFNWFASWAYNKSHPDEGTASAYGFGPLLGSSSEENSGSAIYLGLRSEIPGTMGGKLGLEFNNGSENWWSYTVAADDVTSKLATRGSVYEAYYIQPLNKTGLDFTVGYQFYDYTHAFSGWHIAPMPMENYELDIAGGVFSPYPYADEISNFYASMSVNF